jgi:outer membrane protein TolC
MGLAAEALSGRPFADVDLRASDAVLSPVSGPANHPDLVRAAEGERAAEARVAEQRAGRLPRLDLSAALLDFGTASGRHVNEWQAGVAISWPLFTGGGRSAAVRRAELDLAAAREDRAAAERGLAALADAAHAAIEEADARALALAASVAQWTEVARIEQLALDTGAGVQSDLLAAEAALFRARAGFAQARYDRLYARVRLARSQGLLDRDWLRRSLEVVP